MGSLFGYEVVSELPLRRLRRARGERGTIEIVRGPESLLDEPGVVTGLSSESARGGGEHVFLLADTGDARLIGCSATGGYRLELDPLRVTVAPRGAAEIWEHRLLSVVIPILLAGHGDLALHAAVVEVEDCAILFCGPPQRGKSTLALAYSRLGHRVLSEDGAVLERLPGGWRAWPAASGARIREPGRDGVVTKVVRELDGEEAAPLPVGAVVLLDERGARLESEPLAPALALTLLTAHLTHAGGQAALAPAFARLAQLLGTVPALRASLPDDLEMLPAAAAELARRAELDERRSPNRLAAPSNLEERIR